MKDIRTFANEEGAEKYVEATHEPARFYNDEAQLCWMEWDDDELRWPITTGLFDPRMQQLHKEMLSKGLSA